MNRRSALALLVAALALPSLAPAEDGNGEKRYKKRQQQQDRAREAVASGEYLPLQQILADALERHPGVVVSVELDDDEYEIEILRPDGVVVELEYDARTGRLLEEEIEDD